MGVAFFFFPESAGNAGNGLRQGAGKFSGKQSGRFHAAVCRVTVCPAARDALSFAGLYGLFFRSQD